MRRPVNVGEAEGCNGRGRDVSFVCGTVVSFSLTIDEGAVLDAKFRTNGCGYMMAAADELCDLVKGSELGDLHGLDDDELSSEVFKRLGPFPEGRHHCLHTAVSALRAAFADHRARVVSEFAGERALICTCFGVTEATIEAKIAARHLETVDEVTAATRAGGGCGSCRMLIQEMLDIAHDL